MGHANYSNLSNLFVNLMFAKGKISIRMAIETAQKRGEQVQASEGGYDDDGMLAMAFGEIISLLVSPDGKGWSGGSGGPWPGPWVEPVWDVYWILKGRVAKIAGRASNVADLLKSCEQALDPQIETRLTDSGDHMFAVAADAVQEEFGDGPWPQYLRRMPAMRKAWRSWIKDGWGDTEDDWEPFEAILFRFLPGWRNRYRDVPRLGNVTH